MLPLGHGDRLSAPNTPLPIQRLPPSGGRGVPGGTGGNPTQNSIGSREMRMGGTDIESDTFRPSEPLAAARSVPRRDGLAERVRVDALSKTPEPYGTSTNEAGRKPPPCWLPTPERLAQKLFEPASDDQRYSPPLQMLGDHETELEVAHRKSHHENHCASSLLMATTNVHASRAAHGSGVHQVPAAPSRGEGQRPRTPLRMAMVASSTPEKTPVTLGEWGLDSSDLGKVLCAPAQSHDHVRLGKSSTASVAPSPDERAAHGPVTLTPCSQGTSASSCATRSPARIISADSKIVGLARLSSLSGTIVSTVRAHNTPPEAYVDNGRGAHKGGNGTSPCSTSDVVHAGMNTIATNGLEQAEYVYAASPLPEPPARMQRAEPLVLSVNRSAFCTTSSHVGSGVPPSHSIQIAAAPASDGPTRLGSPSTAFPLISRQLDKLRGLSVFQNVPVPATGPSNGQVHVEIASGTDPSFLAEDVVVTPPCPTSRVVVPLAVASAAVRDVTPEKPRSSTVADSGVPNRKEPTFTSPYHMFKVTDSRALESDDDSNSGASALGEFELYRLRRHRLSCGGPGGATTQRLDRNGASINDDDHTGAEESTMGSDGHLRSLVSIWTGSTSAGSLASGGHAQQRTRAQTNLFSGGTVPVEPADSELPNVPKWFACLCCCGWCGGCGLCEGTMEDLMAFCYFCVVRRGYLAAKQKTRRTLRMLNVFQGDLSRVTQIYCLGNLVSACIIWLTCIAMVALSFAEYRMVVIKDGSACEEFMFRDKELPNLLYSVITFMVNALFTMWLAFRAARLEKAGFLVVQWIAVLVQLSRLLYFASVLTEHYFSSTVAAIFTAVLVLAGVVLLTSSALAVFVFREFGWRTYKKGITQSSAIERRKKSMHLESCIQADIVVTINAMITTLYLIDSPTPLWISCGVSAFTLAALLLFLSMVRRRQVWFLYVVCLLGSVTLAFHCFVISSAAERYYSAAQRSDLKQNVCYSQRLPGCLREHDLFVIRPPSNCLANISDGSTSRAGDNSSPQSLALLASGLNSTSLRNEPVMTAAVGTASVSLLAGQGRVESLSSTSNGSSAQWTTRRLTYILERYPGPGWLSLANTTTVPDEGGTEWELPEGITVDMHCLIDDSAAQRDTSIQPCNPSNGSTATPLQPVTASPAAAAALKAAATAVFSTAKEEDPAPQCLVEFSTLIPTHGSGEEYFEARWCNEACYHDHRQEIFEAISSCCAEYGSCRLRDEVRTYATTALIVLTLLGVIQRVTLVILGWRRMTDIAAAAVAGRAGSLSAGVTARLLAP